MTLTLRLAMAPLAAMSAAFPVCSAEVCGRTDVQGAYGFQLSGASSISGTLTPLAAVGRLVFDGAKSVSGTSSVNFKGLFLGNPVTGSYEFKDTDCSLSFQLQDDSGAFQPFTGTARPGGATVEFHQTGDGAGARGVLERVAETCAATGFRGTYAFALSGVVTPLATGRSPGSARSAKGTVEADGDGKLAFAVTGMRTTGTYSVDSDCIVQVEFALPTEDGESSAIAKLRGVLVSGGKEVLAVQTDPQQTAVARFLAR